MAEIIRGKGVISGIAMGKIMLAGQNLDGYLVNYEPEDKETEKKKAQDALTAVAEILRESIEKLKRIKKLKRNERFKGIKRIEGRKRRPERTWAFGGSTRSPSQALPSTTPRPADSWAANLTA